MPASQSAVAERAGRAQAEAAIMAATPGPVDFEAFRRREIERFRATPMSPFALCLARRGDPHEPPYDHL